MKEKIDTKQVQFSPTIAEHDLKTKIRQMEKFFEKEKQVKCVILFKGRNIIHPENGEKIFDFILNEIKKGKLVNRGTLKGNTMEMFLVPKK
jgi:translation initiation factor IF-3